MAFFSRTLLASALAPVALLVTVAATRAAPPVATPATHEVRMINENGAYKYSPAKLMVKRGDSVKFVMVSGAPHNVAFETEGMPQAAQTSLDAAMTDQMQPFAGPLLMKEGQSYTISFANVPDGTYSFFCMPHVAMDMKGTITVQ